MTNPLAAPRKTMSAETTVVIASPLETAQVDRIRAVPGVRVLHDAALIPTPRYVADHKGIHPRLSAEEEARWRAMLSQADVLFDFDWFEPVRTAENAPRLRWIQATSSGIAQVIERIGVDPSAFTITTAAGVHAVPLAEFAAAGLLHFVKGVPRLTRWKAQAHWERYTTGQLAGRVAVVVGLGHVGRASGELLAALGVRVIAVGRDGRDYDLRWAERVVGMSQLDEALAAADAIVLCCPLTPETEGLLSRERITALGPGTILVNIARGGVVDEPALIEALREERIAGAALDVASIEPLPAESELWALDNVLISPHSASTVPQENGRIVDIFIENLERFRRGEPLVNTYDPARGY